MSDYTPDRWVMLKITSNGEEIYKVLASWYGGYLGSDSWKLNSGVVSIEEDDNSYTFIGYSGSRYHCYKNNYGMSGYTSRIYEDFKHKAELSEGKININLLEETTDFGNLVYST